MERPFVPQLGSVSNSQFTDGSFSVLTNPAGIWIAGSNQLDPLLEDTLYLKGFRTDGWPVHSPQSQPPQSHNHIFLP